MRTALYSAIFGGYDHARPVPTIPGVDCILFTDDAFCGAAGWTVVLTPSNGTHPRMEAKQFKLRPREVLPDYDRTLWIDGNQGLKTPEAVEGALACVGDVGFAVHKHPDRDCIFDEATVSARMPKYRGQPIWAQVEHYSLNGHPEHWGLWAGGMVASVRGPADDVLEAWWEENVRWSYQDQLSLPFVCRRAGLRPSEFPDNQLRSPWFGIGGHNRED